MARLEGGTIRPDLVILDVHLPDVLGMQEAQFVHERQPGTPIVFTPAYPLPAQPFQTRRFDLPRQALRQARTRGRHAPALTGVPCRRG